MTAEELTKSWTAKSFFSMGAKTRITASGLVAAVYDCRASAPPPRHFLAESFFGEECAVRLL